MIELALVAALALGSPVGEGSVHGIIVSDRGDPVGGVRVELRSQRRVVWSDETGAYAFEGVEPGEHEIRFSRFAFEPLQLSVTVPETSTLNLDVELQTRFVVLPEISVRASRAFDPRPIGSRGLPELGSRAISSSAMTWGAFVPYPDALTPLRTVPGVDLDEESPTQFHVRGGSADENLILLDGAPVYNGNHTSGILSAVNPDAVERLDIHTGVMPARFGGRLSSVVDIETIDSAAEQSRLRGGIGIPDARLGIAAPLPFRSGSAYVSGRRTTYDVIGRSDLGGNASGFEDALGKVALDLLQGRLRVTSMNAENWYSALADPSLEDAVIEDLSFDPTNSTRWSSRTDAVSWSRVADSGSEIDLRYWRATTRSTIEWGPIAEQRKLSNVLKHTGLAGETAWSRPSGVGRFGASVEWFESSYENWLEDTRFSPSLLRLEGHPMVVSSHIEYRWIPRNRWIFTNGLRAAHIERHGVVFEPRFSAHYRPRSWLTLSAGYGRTHQFVQSLANEESLLTRAFSVAPLVASDRDGTPVSRADQWTMGFETRLAEHFLLTVDGYVKRLDDLVLVAPSTREPFAIDEFTVGTGRAHGVSTALAYRGRRVEAETLVEWGAARRSGGGQTYAPRFERRRSLAIAAVYRVLPSTTVRAAFQASAGVPTSAVMFDGFDWEVFDQLSGEVELLGTPLRADSSVNAERLPTYTRLDLGVRKEWRIGGVDALATRLDVLNVLNRSNTVGLQRDEAGVATRDLHLSPISVLVGIDWRF